MIISPRFTEKQAGRHLCAVLVAFALAAMGACGLTACGDGQIAAQKSTDMKEVTPSIITGLDKKIVASSYKDALVATVTVEPAYGREVNLERYDTHAKTWMVEQTYTTENEPAAQVTIDFGTKWKQRSASKWRVNAPAAADKGPEHETLGDAQAKTQIANDFLASKAAVVMDAQTGQVVYEHKATKKRKIASMTKMLTAVVLAENREAGDPVKITKDVWDTEYSFGFSKGDVLTAEQVIYAMMLPSSNDAAAAAAYEVGGSLEGFAELMNEKARQIGCTDSVFVTPHGLDAKAAHSTALDVARIGSYIMTSGSCETVRKAAATKKYSFSVSAQKKVKNKKTKKTKIKTVTHAYSLVSTNEMLNGKDNALGLKTGYTDGAGACFCGAFEIDGRVYVTVMMGGDDYGDRWKDTRRLLKFTRYALKSGFPEYEL